MTRVPETVQIDFASLELLPYGVIVLDESGTVLFYNAREQEIAGRAAVDVLGKNFFNEVAPCTKAGEFFDRFEETVAGEGKAAEFRFHFPFPDRPRDVDIALTGFTYGDERLCLVSVKDVTEEEEVRGRIMNSERFADVGEIASGVAHNFNNTLMAISTWVEVMRRQLPPDHKAQKAAAQISRAVEDGVNMVRRIRGSLGSTSGIGSGDLRVDLRLVFENAIAQVRPRLERRRAELGDGVQIESDVDETTARVRGFSGELGEVFLNLLSNALDSLGREGKVTIRSFSKGDRTFVEVIDTGTGMSIETQRKLFRPLFSTKGAAGTGLGLSSAFATVKRHGGEFEVESSPSGSTFRVILPSAE